MPYHMCHDGKVRRMIWLHQPLKASEYVQEMPQSMITDQLFVPIGREMLEHKQIRQNKSMNTISNATSSLFLNEKIAKLKGTQTASPHNKEFTQKPHTQWEQLETLVPKWSNNKQERTRPLSPHQSGHVLHSWDWG